MAQTSGTKKMNTVSDRTWRDKYRSAVLEKLLRGALVTEAICEVDRSDLYRIQSPYGSQPTAEVQALSGYYVVDDYTTTDDALTVTDEVIVAEHIFDFEEVMTNFNLFANRTEEMIFSVASKIDRFALNNLTEDATGTYTTPLGGFTDPVNINEILSELLGKVAGYTDVYKGLFLVIENTDLPGFIESQAKSGFSFADAALKNGFYASPMGIDVYVVRTGTFADETLGTTTYTNDGHRVFGVKNVATYASPRGIRWEEKRVSGKTGMEIVCYGYIGFKLWTPKTDLVVDITLA
jgi:hypothetical protein